ncbi:MAG: class E sortase [Acidimicrobiia bacterium]
MAPRVLIRRIGWGLIWISVLIFAFLGYQLVVTDLLNQRVQTQAKVDLAADLAARRVELPEPEVVTVDEGPTPTTEPDTPPTTEPEVSFIPEQAGPEGATLGRIVIPKIELDDVMFEGVTRDTLKKGPGHMPGTPVPGQPGNAVVSGHRTTYGRPFYDLDALSYGDRIEVETATGMHVYEVRNTLIVDPTDVSVTKPIAGAWLTLTTCNPRFSAAERLVVQAVLVSGPNLDYANLLAKQADGSEKST